jgi:hypothetical protein
MRRSRGKPRSLPSAGGRGHPPPPPTASRTLSEPSPWRSRLRCSSLHSLSYTSARRGPGGNISVALSLSTRMSDGRRGVRPFAPTASHCCALGAGTQAGVDHPGVAFLDQPHESIPINWDYTDWSGGPKRDVSRRFRRRSLRRLRGTRCRGPEPADRAKRLPEVRFPAGGSSRPSAPACRAAGQSMSGDGHAEDDRQTE